MKKLFALLLVFGCLVFAEEAKVFNGELDNFEDGNISEAPAWWTFGDSEQNVVESSLWAKDPLIKYLGKYALQIKGTAQAWYVGGIGRYLAVDATLFTHVKAYVYGEGPDSGKLTFQLYDDDNGNFTLEQDVNNNYEPIFDDKFEYTVNVKWKGWKVLLIPFTAFKDTNPKVGDNVWNPDHLKGSGGLLHFQFIFVSNTKTGTVDMAIDNVRLINLRGGKGTAQ
jgi:hypothetical protein